MAQLAIKGHSTRGNEVSQLLKMLGGKRTEEINADDEEFYYYIDKFADNGVYCTALNEDYAPFTLEEFESEFSYKVGDKVIVWIDGCRSICNIQNMEWDSIANEIKYKIQDYWYSTINLQPYIEENMETAKITIIPRLPWDKDKIELEVTNGYEIKDENGKTYVVKKKPTYPKTYGGCCGVLGYKPDEDEISCYQGHLIESFVKLLICRDAYWKMGLGKPWEPDWTQQTTKYCIWNCKNKVDRFESTFANFMLAFPTAEMRDTFYENFWALIEQCKELL